MRLFLIFLYLVLSVNLTFAQCTVSTTAVSFGLYDIFLTAPTDSTGNITISCGLRPPPYVTVSISESPNSGGFTPRRMRLVGGEDLMDYNLYTDGTYSSIWGDGTSGTTTRIQKITPGKDKSYTLIIYGRIPPGQDVSTGSYSDTLTVTINW